MKKRKEDLKELVLYTVFGNMTFIISIASYAVFNVALGINELIANALAWVFAVLFSYITNKRWVFRVSTPTKTAALVQMFAFFSGRFFTLIIEETIIFCFYNDAFVPKHVGEAGCPGGGSGAQLHN